MSGPNIPRAMTSFPSADEWARVGEVAYRAAMIDGADGVLVTQASGGPILSLEPGEWFRAKLTATGSPYSWTEVRAVPGGGYVVPSGAATGAYNAFEYNGTLTLPVGTIVRMKRVFANEYRFVEVRNGAGGCANTVCVHAYAIKPFCDSYPTVPDCTGGNLPGKLSGVPVTITRSYTDGTGTHTDAYDSGTTDATGKYCKALDLVTLADPTVAPTVAASGGGASGGTLPVGTYRAVYSWVTNYGETLGSPASADFQVGIPDPSSYPTLAAPSIVLPTLSPGGSLAVGTYTAKAIYADAGGLHNFATTASPSITVATLGDIPRISLPALTLRPNATQIFIYLENGSGDYYLYKTVTAGGTVNLDLAFSTSSPMPFTNNSAKNIPRVTFTTGGIKSRIYALASPSATTGRRWESTTSPVDLGGTLPGLGFSPPAYNTTADGAYHVSAHPANCNKRTGDFTFTHGVATPCDFTFGFCCFAHDLTITDVDTGAALTPAVSCGNPSACTDEDGDANPSSGFNAAFTNNEHSEFVGPCVGNPCPAPVTKPTSPCDQIPNTGSSLDGSNATSCTLTLSGYWDDIICVPAPCAVPGIRTSKSGVMYSKAKWVQFFGCCCPTHSCRANTPRPEMIPTTLYTAISGPAWLVGGGGTYTLNYIGRTGANSQYETWTTGIITGQGGYGSCYKTSPPFGGPDPDGSDCWYYRDIPYCSDTTKYPISLCNNQQLFYANTRITLLVGGPGNLSTTPNHCSPGSGPPIDCQAAILYENLGLPGGCPSGWNAEPQWRTCQLTSACGGGACTEGYYRVLGYQGTASCTIPLSLASGASCQFFNPVSYSGSGMSDNTITGCGTLANASLSS